MHTSQSWHYLKHLIDPTSRGSVYSVVSALLFIFTPFCHIDFNVCDKFLRYFLSILKETTAPGPSPCGARGSVSFFVLRQRRRRMPSLSLSRSLLLSPSSPPHKVRVTTDCEMLCVKVCNASRTARACKSVK